MSWLRHCKSMSYADRGLFRDSVCRFRSHRTRLSRLAVKRKSEYKCVQVTDPHAKRWLADDPKFLASLNDLDRGLARRGAATASPRTDVGTAEARAAPPTPPPRSAAAPGRGCRSRRRAFARPAAINTRARAGSVSASSDTPLSRPLPRPRPLAGVGAAAAAAWRSRARRPRPGRAVRCSICFRRPRSSPTAAAGDRQRRRLRSCRRRVRVPRRRRTTRRRRRSTR